MTLRCHGVGIRAHRAVLSAHCPYFHALFTSGLRESSQGEITLHAPFTPAALQQALVVFYGGAIKEKQLAWLEVRARNNR